MLQGSTQEVIFGFGQFSSIVSESSGALAGAVQGRLPEQFRCDYEQNEKNSLIRGVPRKFRCALQGS
jgi:hypothetical protein